MKKHLKVAAYLVLTKNEQILLSQRYNTGWEDGKFSLVSGHVEIDETPTRAIIREAREEASITVEASDLSCVQIAHRFAGADLVYIDYFFRSTKWKGEPRICEPEKCSALEWHGIRSLPSQIIPYVNEVITRIYEEKYGLFEYGWEDNNQIEPTLMRGSF